MGHVLDIANFTLSSAKGSTSLFATSSALSSPSEVSMPALMKHLTTVHSETSFHAIAVHRIACKISIDIQTSDAVEHSSILLTTCVTDKHL